MPISKAVAILYVVARTHTISERLRAAILAAPGSRRRIALATGVAESVLSRFARGQHSIDLRTADKLAAHLGLDLLPTGRRRRRGQERTRKGR